MWLLFSHVHVEASPDVRDGYPWLIRSIVWQSGETGRSPFSHMQYTRFSRTHQSMRSTLEPGYCSQMLGSDQSWKVVRHPLLSETFRLEQCGLRRRTRKSSRPGSP